MSDEHQDLPPPIPLTKEQADYNKVTDLVTGPNVRKSDNLFQGIAVAVFALAGFVVGNHYAKPDEKYTARLVGVLAGLIAGVILSGTAIGVYRALRHKKGKHD
jgi:hypothetical protein